MKISIFPSPSVGRIRCIHGGKGGKKLRAGFIPASERDKRMNSDSFLDSAMAQAHFKKNEGMDAGEKEN